MSSKKRILIISRSFYPRISPRAFRTTELAQELSRLGHEVKVIVPKFENQGEFSDKYGIQIKELGDQKWRDFKLTGTFFILLLKRIFNRISRLLFEYPNIELLFLVKKTLKNERNYDALISVAVPYPIHWGVAMAWSKNKIKNPARIWIADCGDPYMGQENDSFKPFFYFKYVEKWFMKKADFITVPTFDSIQAYYPEFHNKIRVIPQGFNFEKIKIWEGERISSIPHFAYPGAFFIGKRDPREFFEYLCGLETDFIFDIYTSSRDIVAPYIQKSKGRIRLKELISREELLFELSKLDFVVNFENAGTKQTPSKLVDYAIIKRPILSIKTGGFKSEVVDQFLKGDYSQSYIVENPDQYRIENVANSFISLMQ